MAKLLGVQQMKVTGQDSSTVIPATILPAAMFREVTEMKVEPTETLEENVGRSSAPAPVSKPNVARPPRPDRPVPVVQAVKRKGTTEGPEQRSEKSRREELLEMALMKSGMNLSPATEILLTQDIASLDSCAGSFFGLAQQY